MQASQEAGRLERELAYAREAFENEANEKNSMEEKFSKMCEELSQQSMQASQEVDRLQGELQKSRTALDKANGESSLLSIDLAGFKSKLAMVEEALEQARTQSSEYEGELARAREALGGRGSSCEARAQPRDEASSLARSSRRGNERIHGGEVLEDVRGAVSAEHASVAGS